MSKGEETRERVIARSAEVFNIHGYSGTAMSDIMRVTGLEKGGIYRHFEGKEQLALAAFDYAIGRVRQRFTDGLAKQTNAADALIAFIGVFRSYTQNPPLAGGCPVLNTAVESDDTHPVLRERTRAAVEEWRAMLRTLVLSGIARGEIRETVDANKLATLMIATMEGALMLSKLLVDPAPLNWAYDHLQEHIETNVRAQP
jgi:TetR/AcrR family transcriptional repressor of nem operon